MCTSPMRAYDTGYLTEKGKPLYRITSNDVEFIHKPINKNVIYSNRPQDHYTDCIIRDYKKIPCGKCIQCRLAYTRVWAIRCMLETLDWEFNYMVTLTYDKENVPVSEKTGCMTTKKKDFQDFMKRLRIEYQRKYEHNNIRYFEANEYGGKTERPHMHFLGFNLPVFDLEPFFLNEYGQQVYKSAILGKIWGKGYVTVCEANWNTCAYVARYIMKKQKGPNAKSHYEELDIEPEGVLMSLKPGIGKKYYDEHKEEIFNNDEIVVKKLCQGKYGLEEKIMRVKPPKYYIDLFEKEFPEFIEELKEHREECAKERMIMELSRTSMTENEYLGQQERIMEKKFKLNNKELIEE